MTRSRGFTLIEMAVVMVIAALILGAVVQYLNAQLSNQRVSTTRTRQDSIKVALVNFLARNNRLPCPALPNLARGAAGDGVEALTGTPPALPCTAALPAYPAVSPVVFTGAVPWATLGLSDDASTDAYSNRFTYQVSASATNLNSTNVALLKGAITLHSAGPATTGAGGNQINDCSNGGPNNPCAAVVVIVSHGVNGFGAYTDAGVQTAYAGSTGPDETENANGDNRFVVKAPSAGSANPYDDFVLALTASDLLSPLTLNGVMKDARGLLNAKVDAIKWAAAGYGINNATAGPPTSYPILLEDTDGSLPAGEQNVVPAALYTALPVDPEFFKDPWGSKLHYTRASAAVQAGFAGTAYTIISNGPDGKLGTADDVTYVVPAAELLSAIQKSQ